MFTSIFCEVDTTFDNYQHLPEYDYVIDWMTDTKDQGLLLMGDCGRGKSIIISGVIPVLLRLKNRWIRIMNAAERYHRPIFATTNRAIGIDDPTVGFGR